MMVLPRMRRFATFLFLALAWVGVAQGAQLGPRRALLAGGPFAAVQYTFAGAASLPSWVSFSRAGNAMRYDSTGKLTYAPNNQLLNSATLSTQSVTTVPANYILSFSGTGTVTLTGTSTAGPLVGTGASNRVFLAFTPTAGSLTLTVSGSVTSAQLELVTYQTTPSTYNPTTAAAYFGPRLDYDPVTLLPKGLLIEEARTNSAFPSINFNGLTGGSWISQTLNFGVAPDGTNTSMQVSWNGGAGFTYTGTFASSAIQYTGSVFVKVNTPGAGQIALRIGDATGASSFADVTYTLANGALASVAGGSTPPTALAVSATTINNGWVRITITATFSVTVATFRSGVHAVTGTASVAEVWGIQVEPGAFATSHIPTAAASVTRAQDVPLFNGAANALFLGQQFTVITETQLLAAQSPGRIIGSDFAMAPITQVGTTSSEFNGSTNLFTGSGLVWTNVLRVASANTGIGRYIAATGVTPVSDGNPFIAAGSPTTFYLFQTGVGTNTSNGWMRSLALYSRALPPATIASKVIVGAPY